MQSRLKRGTPDGPPGPWVLLAAWGPCGFSPVARYRLIRNAGAWSPTEFQFFLARFWPSDSARGSKVTGSRWEK